MNGSVKHEKVITARRKSVSEVVTSPVLTFHKESGSGNGVSYGLCYVQGYRAHMEDRHVSKAVMQSNHNFYRDASFFAVFDGHGGHWVSEHCAHDKHGFLPFIASDAELVKLLEQQSPFTDYRECIKRLFLDYDKKIRREIDYKKNQSDSCGSTAVVLIIYKRHVLLANCGDSRGAVYIDYNNYYNRVTTDHSVTNILNKDNIGAEIRAERKRFEGLRFEMDKDRGLRKTNDKLGHGLMVTRSFGDFDFKGDSLHNLLTSSPCLNHGNHLLKGEEKVSVLASDGVWDVFSTEEVCEFVVRQLGRRCKIDEVAEDVLLAALEAGSRDNMTLIIVALQDSLIKDCRQKMQAFITEFSSLRDFLAKEIESRQLASIKNITDQITTTICHEVANKMVSVTANSVFHQLDVHVDLNQSLIRAYNKVSFYFWAGQCRLLLERLRKDIHGVESITSAIQRLPTLDETAE